MYAGKKLTLKFASQEDRELFRVKLYKLKGVEDQSLLVLEEPLKTLRFEKFEQGESGEDFFPVIYAKIYMVEKKKPDTFEVVEIDDGPET